MPENKLPLERNVTNSDIAYTMDFSSYQQNLAEIERVQDALIDDDLDRGQRKRALMVLKELYDSNTMLVTRMNQSLTSYVAGK